MKKDRQPRASAYEKELADAMNFFEKFGIKARRDVEYLANRFYNLGKEEANL